MNNPGNKTRDPILIEPRYSASFVVRFLAISCLSFLAFTFLLFLLLNRRLGISYIHDITTLNTLFEKLPLIASTAGFLQAAISSLVLLLLALYWAHAVAGPLVRFRRYLDIMGQNKDSVEEIAFRATDQLHELARAFKTMAKASDRRKKEFSVCCLEVKRLLDEYDQLSKIPKGSAQGLDEKRQEIRRLYGRISALFESKESM